MPFASPRKFVSPGVPVGLRAVNWNLAGDFTNHFTLVGNRAYGVTDASIGAVDLATGKTIWETSFPDANPDAAGGFGMYTANGPASPVMSSDEHTTYAAQQVTVHGSGTTSDTAVIQLAAVDAGSGKLEWSANIPLGADALYRSANGTVTRVVGLDHGRILVAQDGDGAGNPGLIAAVDSISHQVLWNKPGTAVDVDAGVAIAVATDSSSDTPVLTGIDLASGKVVWGGADQGEGIGGITTVHATSGSLVASIEPASGAPGYSEVLDPTTGKATKTFAGVDLARSGSKVTAIDDNRLLVEDTDGVRMLDGTTLKPIWSLPQGNRIAPKHVVAFGGHLYGQTNHGASVVLDASTGKDAAVASGEFVAVNQFGALMIADSGLVFAAAAG